MRGPNYSIKNSPEVRSVISIIKRFAEDRADELVEDFQEFCFLLNAPPNLEKLLYLCKHQIPLILAECENQRLNTRLLKSSKRWIEWFNANIKHFQADEEAKNLLFIDVREINKNPLQGWGLGRHALYAALFYTTEDESKQVTWAKVALMLWLAQSKVLSKHFQQEDYKQYHSDFEFISAPYSVNNAGRSLRQLSDIANAHYLDLLESTDSIYEELGRISEDNKQIQPIVTYIEKVFGDKEFKCRNKGSGGGHRGRQRPPGHIDLGNGVEIYEVISDREEEGYIELIGQGLEEKEIKTLVEDDFDPDEFIDGAQLTLHDVDCETTNKNVMGRILSAKGKSQHIRMSNQLLPFDYRQLALGEVVEIYKYLIEECNGILLEGGASQQVSDKVEVPLMLLVMLVTGSTLERVCKLTVLKDGEKSSKSEMFLCKNGQEKSDLVPYEWGVNAFEPKYQNAKIRVEVATKEQKPYFFLPDLLGVAPLVVDYKKRSERNNKKKNAVFQRSISRYKKEIKLYLKSIPCEIIDRATERMISNFLLYQIGSVSGDITAASCITGQGHRLAGSRIHYTTLTTNYLRKVMKESLGPLLRSVGGKCESSHIAKTKVPHAVGARYCLAIEAYQKAAKEIGNKLQSYAYPETMGQLAQYHNLYTAYTVWMFNFSIANRANNNPMLPVKDIDEVTGVSTYRDKDYEKPYHARLVWIPEMVTRQLRNYEEHLSAIKSIVSVYRDLKKNKDYSQQGFFLSGSLKPEIIKPSSMKKYLYKYYINAPNNSHRRFIRSELVEKGRPIESIDALLGHWFNGEEPWSYYSSFSFEAHLDLLKQEIEGMMKKVGFRVYQSRLINVKV